MPRLANAGPEVTRWHSDNDDGNGSSTFDLCSECAAMSHEQLNLHPNMQPYNGDPQGEDWEEIEHAPYNNLEYECEVCGAELTNEDN